MFMVTTRQGRFQLKTISVYTSLHKRDQAGQSTGLLD